MGTEKSEVKRTPGPWRYIPFGDFHFVRCSKGYGLADVTGFFNLPVEANARLIAAAPELYEALNNLLRVHECEGGTKYHVGDIARAALRKARGE